jgi:radical SAM protein with 4Fe4S-binding SPASM domain
MSSSGQRARELGRQLVRHYVLTNPRKGLRILRSAGLGAGASLSSRWRSVAFPPTTLIVRITHRCNLRCVQCGQWGEHGVWTQTRPEQLADELTTADWVELIDTHQRALSHIYFWGGEPLLRNDLWEIIAAASRRGITTELSTNGTLLRAQHERVAESGLDYLSVSLDGPAKVNESIRRGAGNGYSAVLDGVQALMDRKRRMGQRLPLTEICMTLTEANQEEIRSLYEVAKGLGVDVFHVQFGIFSSEPLLAMSETRFRRAFGGEPRFFRGFKRDVSRMRADSIRDQLAWIKRDVDTQAALLFRQTPAIACDIDDYFHRPERFLGRPWCAIPWQYMQIMPNGDVAFCMDFADFIAGNVRTEDLLSIWNGPRARKFREELMAGGPFAACSRCCTWLASASKLALILRQALRR